MTHAARIACLAVVFVLLVPAARAGDDDGSEAGPQPEAIAGWILWGGGEGREAGAAVLAGASPEFVGRVIDALRAKGGDPEAWIDELIDAALATRGEARARAVRRLAGFGEHGIRRLLARLVAPPRPAPSPGVAARGPGAGPAAPSPERPGASVMVQIDVRLVSGPRGMAARLFGDARAEGTHLLGAEEAARALDAMKAEERIEFVLAPSLLLLEGEWGDVRVGAPIAYVREYRIERGDGVVIADPVIDTVDEGVVLELRATLERGGSRVSLEGALAHTAVGRPIPRRSIRIEGGPEPVEIQVPEIQTTKLDLHVVVPDGEFVVGTGLPDPRDPQRETFVLLQPRVVSAQAAPERGAAPPLPPGVEDTPEDAGMLVNLHVDVVQASPAALRRVLGRLLPTPDVPTLRLTADQVRDLLGPDGTGGDGIEIVAAPRLTCFDEQRANVSILSEFTYRQDVDVVQTIQEGLVVELLPRVYADGETVGVKVEATFADLDRPVKEITTRDPDTGEEVTLQVPELHVSRLKATVELAAGRAVFLGGLGTTDGDVRFVLLRAEVLGLGRLDPAEWAGDEIDLIPPPR